MKRLLGLLLAVVLIFAVFSIAEGETDESASVIKVPVIVLGNRFNPCEGAYAVVTWTDVKMIVRDVENPAGHTHIIDTWIAKLSDDLGYRGQVTWPWKANVGQTVTTLNNLIVTAHKPGTGKTIRIHMLAHMTIVDGEPVVNFEISDFTCVGKPGD